MVYIIEGSSNGETIFKVGTTGQDVWERLRQIQRNTPLQLDLVAVMIGDRSDEKIFLQAFGKYRIKGEWFSDCKGLRKLIKDFPVSVWEDDFHKLRFGEIEIEEFYIKHTLLRFELPDQAIKIARKNLNRHIV